MICDKCKRTISLIHSIDYCTYYALAAEMKEKRYVEMGNHPDLQEILTANPPTVRHRWYIDHTRPLQGHVDFVFFPHWVENAVDLYRDSIYGGMNLIEFLEKMVPS